MSLLRNELDCVRYGRTAKEAIDELLIIEESVFGFGCSGNAEDIYSVVLEDKGLLKFLDDIAKRRAGKEEFPLDSPYHRIERVKEMLLSEGRLPYEIRNIQVKPLSPEEKYNLEQAVFFEYGGTPEGWEEYALSDRELAKFHN